MRALLGSAIPFGSVFKPGTGAKTEADIASRVKETYNRLMDRRAAEMKHLPFPS